jgi:hypothetical protein
MNQVAAGSFVPDAPRDKRRPDGSLLQLVPIDSQSTVLLGMMQIEFSPPSKRAAPSRPFCRLPPVQRQQPEDKPKM